MLTRMLEILAPGGSDFVAFLECYFDESGTHDGSPVLCVAGYLFDQDQCKALDLKWKASLERYKLPFFRMSACAHNTDTVKVYPFEHLSAAECIAVEKEMIGHINEHALLGVAVAVNETEYNALFGSNSPAGTPYAFCCWQVLAGIQSWILRNQFRGRGKAAYFFEAGHRDQSEANALMKRIFDNKTLRQNYCYGSHSFVEKESMRPIQKADILAWHQATQVKRWLKNDTRMRADFRALASKPRHELFIGNQTTLGGVVARQRWIQGLPVYNGLTGHFGATWFWCPFRGDAGLVIGESS